MSWATLLLMAFLTTHVQAGNVYRWVDEQGRVHYGDAAAISFEARPTSEVKRSEITDTRRQDAHRRIAEERETVEGLLLDESVLRSKQPPKQR